MKSGLVGGEGDERRMGGGGETSTALHDDGSMHAL